jgi:hypothetical protein
LKEPANPWRKILPPSRRLYQAGRGHLELFRDRSELVARAMARCLKDFAL